MISEMRCPLCRGELFTPRDAGHGILCWELLVEWPVRWSLQLDLLEWGRTREHWGADAHAMYDALDRGTDSEAEAAIAAFEAKWTIDHPEAVRARGLLVFERGMADMERDEPETDEDDCDGDCDGFAA